jgi:F-type H+-transporting ATPase subunit delta
VAAASSESGLVSSRYAAALLDMAAKANAVSAVEQDMSDLGRMIAGSPDLLAFIRNPLLDRAQQQRAVKALADSARFNALTANFLGVLVANRRLVILQDMIRAFHTELIRRRGETTARVEAATPLSPDQTRALQDQLGKAVGSHVTVEVTVNKDLLGGMIVTIGSKQIDSSVRHKLDRLKRAMTQGRAA